MSSPSPAKINIRADAPTIVGRNGADRDHRDADQGEQADDELTQHNHALRLLTDLPGHPKTGEVDAWSALGLMTRKSLTRTHPSGA